MGRVLGLDFDNTIVCYDGVFHAAAVRQQLIPESVGHSKNEVRDYLRNADREEDWTLLQGHVYGTCMEAAAAYPGVMDFLVACRAAGWSLRIISHKTRVPVLGTRYNLHQAARDWLIRQGFLDPRGLGMTVRDLSFCETRRAKLEAIAAAGCDLFIDDLPEVFAEPRWPAEVLPVLFDPDDCSPAPPGGLRFTSWDVATEQLLQVLHGR